MEKTYQHLFYGKCFGAFGPIRGVRELSEHIDLQCQFDIRNFQTKTTLAIPLSNTSKNVQERRCRAIKDKHEWLKMHAFIQ